MKLRFNTTIVVLIFCLLSNLSHAQSKYKCLIQMNNYMGDAAYISISLITPKGAYEKTLYVLGSDKKWYKTLKAWNKFYLKHGNISAVTSASISGGDRTMKVLDINESLLNKGYSIRFESAVEDKEYHEQDAEVPLTVSGLSTKTAGKGYIRFVQFSKVK